MLTRFIDAKSGKLRGKLWHIGLMVVLGIGGLAGCGRSNDPQKKVQPQPDRVHIGKHPKDHSVDIFATTAVLRVEIEISRSGMNLLSRGQWSGGGEERPVAKATVREAGSVYQDVAVHLKGAAGSFRQVSDRPALTLNFDKFVPGQSFHGLHKISLNNSVQDPSRLSEKICREVFDAVGVPVPRANYALVTLNGRDLGLYVMLEGANKQFLKRYFPNAQGNLYDGGFVRDVDESLAVNSGDNPEDRSDLSRLLDAAGKTSRARDLAPLREVLDVERFISMLAVEVMVFHWDGYGLNKNNWRLFHDVDRDKMVFIPHGLDQTFGIMSRGDGRVPPRSWSGRLAATVMSTAEGRKLFLERCSQIYTNQLQTDRVLARIDAIESVLNAAMTKERQGEAEFQKRASSSFKQMVRMRLDSVGRQLAKPATPALVGGDGVVPIKGWTVSTVRTGEPQLSKTQAGGGRELLGITASGPGICSGSWRSRLLIGPGQYRFSGKVLLKDVQIEGGDRRAGAGLRISKGPPPPKRIGNTDWEDFSYEFEISDDAGDVELICELARATQGAAWFDASSLRLVRVR